MKILPINYHINLNSKHWDLNLNRVNDQAYASINEMSSVKVSGASNPAGVEPMQVDPKLCLDVSELYNAITNVNDRVRLLMMMNKLDILNLLFLLDKSKLVLGMNFFNPAKLLEFIGRMPKGLLLEALLMHMSQRDLLSLLPLKELIRMLMSPKIKEKMIIDALKHLPTYKLKQILESVLGRPIGNLKHGEILKMMWHMKKRQLVECMLGLSQKQLWEIMQGFTKKNPELLLEISHAALFKPFTKFSKSMLVQSFMVMPTSDMVKLMGNLPKELLAMVASMIDPADLAEVVANQFPDLMSSLAEAMAS